MAMKEASEKASGAGYNVFPVWKEWLNAKTLVRARPRPNSTRAGNPVMSKS
jgi:hypothetical protein